MAGGIRAFWKTIRAPEIRCHRQVSRTRTKKALASLRGVEVPFTYRSNGALVAACQSMGRGQHRVARSAALASAILIVLLFPAQEASAAKLGGPYYVDDAEIGNLGSCEVESWGSFAANGNRIAVFSPACVVNPGSPVELGTNLVNTRSDGDGNSTVSLTAKTVALPIGPTGFGLAVAGAVTYDPINHTNNGLIFNVPVTFDFSKELRVNVNVGAQYNWGDPRGLFATAGVGVSWNFVKQWSVSSEVFALIGPGESNPRFQSGVRYSPTKDIDCDLIYGRNLTGEGANWITLALTVRIGDN